VQPSVVELSSGFGHVSIAHPKAWNIATRPISHDRFFATALATFPLPASDNECGAFPVEAVNQAKRPGSADAFIYVQVAPFGEGPRPKHIDATTGHEIPEVLGCHRRLPNRDYDQWIAFDDHGNGVIVSIAFGEHAPTSLRTEVYRAVSSINHSYP
jgi:hypothetical protein